MPELSVYQFHIYFRPPRPCVPCCGCRFCAQIASPGPDSGPEDGDTLSTWTYFGNDLVRKAHVNRCRSLKIPQDARRPRLEPWSTLSLLTADISMLRKAKGTLTSSFRSIAVTDDMNKLDQVCISTSMHNCAFVVLVRGTKRCTA